MNSIVDRILNFTAAKLKGGTQMELLWENASPGSNFAAQTINLNLSEYDKFEIEYFNAIDLLYTRSLHPKNKSEVNVFRSIMHKSETLYAYKRNVTISDTGITFSGCYGKIVTTSYTNQNNLLIPIKIYGIKIIGGGIN